MTPSRLPFIALSLFFALTWAAFGCAQDSGAAGPVVAKSPQFQQFQSAGQAATVTVFPTLLGTNPSKQVGEVVGLLLERAGMTNVETTDAAFRPPADADTAATAAAFGEYVKGRAIETDYALYAEFRASPQRKFTEVRTIVVTRSGEIVWADRQSSTDSDFKRIMPAEPMQCCILVVERLRPILSLGDPISDNAPAGKLAKKFDADTGIPDKAEQAAMKNRLAAFKKNAVTSTVDVFPPRAGDETSSEAAAALVKLINNAGLAKATAAPQSAKLTVQPNMNEQKVLWSMARAFRDQVRKSPPDADYTLYADYLMGKGGVGAVHFVICDRKGEWVIVDFQNSHHADFQSIDPKSRADCDTLLMKRLVGYCK